MTKANATEDIVFVVSMHMVNQKDVKTMFARHVTGMAMVWKIRSRNATDFLVA